MPPMKIIWTAIAAALIGCGPDSSGGEETDTETNGGESGNRPTDASADAMGEFLADEGHRGEGWTAETDQPRAAADVVSPHGRVRVFLNDELAASQAAGNVGNTPHDPWSMAVKEFYDDDDQTNAPDCP